MTDSAEIAIVGAGIMGLATAHALCRDGQGRGGALRPRRAGLGRLGPVVLDGAPALLERGDGAAGDGGDAHDRELGGRGRRGRRRLRPLRLSADRARAARGRLPRQRHPPAGPGPRHALPGARRDRRGRPGALDRGRRGRRLRARWRLRRRAEDVPGLVRRGGVPRARPPARLRRACDPGAGRPRYRRRDRPRVHGRRHGGDRDGRMGERPAAADRRRAADRAAPAAGDRRPPPPRRAAALGGVLGRRQQPRRAAGSRPPFLRRGLRRRGRARAGRRLRPRHLARLPRRRRAGRSPSAIRAWPSSRSSAGSRAPTTSRPTGTRSSAPARASRGCTWPSAGAGTGSSSRPRWARWSPPR